MSCLLMKEGKRVCWGRGLVPLRKEMFVWWEGLWQEGEAEPQALIVSESF